MTSAPRLFHTLLASLFLVACGGGGDSDSNGPSGQVPQSPPAVPTISYSGADGPVDLDNDNVGAMADAALESIQIAVGVEQIVSQLGAQEGVVNERRAGPEGGSVHITGRIANDTSGWYEAEFDGYREAGQTFDGTQVLEFLQTASANNGNVTRRRTSFHGLRRRAEAVDLTYTGHITHESCCVMASEETFSGELLVSDALTQRVFNARDVEISRTTVPHGFALDVALRAFDSRYGYVDVETEGPLYYEPLEATPHHGVALRGTGADGRYLRVVPKSTTIAALEYVRVGSSVPDTSARVLWAESLESQTTQEPVDRPRADSGASRYVVPGTEVTLDGRLSEHSQTSFLTYSWTLLLKPPGSTAELDSLTATTPRLTPDLEGQYLVQLQVSDGQRTSRDVLELTADPETNALPNPITAQLTPDERFAEVAPFAVAPAIVGYQSFDDPMSSLVLGGFDANGDTIGLQQPQSNGPATVLPASRGVHSVILSQGTLSNGGVKPIDVKWVATDAPMPFAPAARAVLPGPSLTSMAVADMNGDALPDIVTTGMNPGGGTLNILYGDGAGFFSAPVTFGVAESGTLALGDVSGDGRNDIVLVAGDQILIIEQMSDGSFDGSYALTTTCYGDSDRDLAIADLNSDGRMDIVVESGCPGRVEYFFQSAGGTMSAALVRDIGVTAQLRLTVGDFDHDGVNDVAIAKRGGPGVPNVAVFEGVLNGDPGTAQFLPYEPAVSFPTRPPITTADVNGDGRDDIVTAENPITPGANRIVILRQAPTGGFQAEIAISTPGETHALRVRDFNGDGFVDIAKNSGTERLDVHYGTSATSFDELTSDIRAARFPDVPLDLNGDGLLDYVSIQAGVLGITLGWEHDPDEG